MRREARFFRRERTVFAYSGKICYDIRKNGQEATGWHRTESRKTIALHALRTKTETDPEKLWHIRRRIVALEPLLTEMNELAELTAHYYDRGYWRNEKYTV